MSINDEDTELRDLLLQTLEKNGVLSKIKAELRAGVFLALESQDQNENSNQKSNRKLSKFQTQCNEGPICMDMIHEFLSFFDLDYTSAVFVVEASSKSASATREELCNKLNITSDTNNPLVASLVKAKQSHPKENNNAFTSAHLERAKEIFKASTNGAVSGFISQETASFLLSQVCQGFPTYLLDKFVQEEISKSSSQKVSWVTFSQMYDKLFTMCSSVVSDVPMPQGNVNTSSEYSRTIPLDQILKSDNDNLMVQEEMGSGNYEGDFNSFSHTSISEDLHGDGNLSSEASSGPELTEDRTIGDTTNDMDYIEDI